MGFDTKYGEVATEHGNIPDDEPVFVIRGQDGAAVQSIRDYAREARQVGADEDFIKEVNEAADLMLEWQKNNRDRVKVPD